MFSSTRAIGTQGPTSPGEREAQRSETHTPSCFSPHRFLLSLTLFRSRRREAEQKSVAKRLQTSWLFRDIGVKKVIVHHTPKDRGLVRNPLGTQQVLYCLASQQVGVRASRKLDKAMQRLKHHFIPARFLTGLGVCSCVSNL